MSLAVRPFAPDDRGPAHDLRQQAFAVRRSPFDPDADDYLPDDRRVTLEADGEVVGTAGAWELGQWFGGRRLPMGGVAGVAVRPDHRGRGGASRLLRRLLETMHERGEVISTLYPATVGLYRRLGWELGGVWLRRRIPARALLALPRPTEAVHVRPLTEDDIAPASALHEALARHEPGQISRPEAFARRVLAPADDPSGYAYVTERDGEVTGYLRYTHEETHDDRAAYDLDVYRLFGRDAPSELALWRLVASSASEAGTVRYRCPPIDPLALWLPELETRAEPFTWHWMTRLVDAPGAVSARGFPDHLDLRVELDVADPELPGNAGPHVLEVRDGRGSLEPGGRGTVRLDVGALASAFTGFASPYVLARAGRLDGGGEDDLAALAAAFASPTPWMRDYF